MKRLDAYLTLLLLHVTSAAYRIRNRLIKTPGATRLFLRENPVPCDASASCHRLQVNFVSQFNSASCSVASVVTVLNALRSVVDANGREPPVTQSEILDHVTVAHWKERVSLKGHEGRRGMPIEFLGTAVESALHLYHIPYREMDVVAFHSNMADAELRRIELMRRLSELSESEHAFLIAHFNQGMLTGDIHLPHISPVGAYHRGARKVLILDVDPDQSEPYWVDVDLFLKAMAWDYHGLLKKYGYEGGGYVWIRLKDALGGEVAHV